MSAPEPRWVSLPVLLTHPVHGDAEQTHIMPILDLQDHSILPGCECGATADLDGVVVHNSFDGREIIERVEMGLPV